MYTFICEGEHAYASNCVCHVPCACVGPRRVLGVLLQVPITLLFTDRVSRCHGLAGEAGLARQ